MKKTFTKLFSTGLLMGLTCIGFAVKAQTTSLTNTNGTQVAPATETIAPYAPKNDFKPADKVTGEKATTTKAAAEDTSWKPQRRLWGYAFGDEYFVAHADNDFVGATGVPEGGAGALSKRGAPELMYSVCPLTGTLFSSVVSI